MRSLSETIGEILGWGLWSYWSILHLWVSCFHLQNRNVGFDFFPSILLNSKILMVYSVQNNQIWNLEYQLFFSFNSSSPLFTHLCKYSSFAICNIVYFWILSLPFRLFLKPSSGLYILNKSHFLNGLSYFIPHQSILNSIAI